MASNVQQKLSNLEMTPPPGAWPAIADRLHLEYDTADTAIAQKMQDTAILPPAAAWENIAAVLPTQEPIIQQPAKVVRLPYRRVRMMAAAVIIGLVGLTAWYFLDYTGPQNGATAVQQQNITPSVTQKENTQSNMLPPVVAPADIQPQEQQLAQRTTAPVSRYANRSGARQASYYPQRYDYQSEADNYIGVPEADPVPLTTQTAPSVEAPLIRDANGQIILDKRLITSPDNQYITITGPNGQQTRISAKFLDIISTLNADTDPQDYFNFMMYDNYLWKIRFSEWRNKLMNQSSFIPTATNFLDILELKDMLQENQ